MRINELARDLEVKSSAIIDYLDSQGGEEKRSHSSRLEEDLVRKVKAHFAAHPPETEPPSKAAEPSPQTAGKPEAPAAHAAPPAGVPTGAITDKTKEASPPAAAPARETKMQASSAPPSAGVRRAPAADAPPVPAQPSASSLAAAPHSSTSLAATGRRPLRPPIRSTAEQAPPLAAAPAPGSVPPAAATPAAGLAATGGTAPTVLPKPPAAPVPSRLSVSPAAPPVGRATPLTPGVPMRLAPPAPGARAAAGPAAPFRSVPIAPRPALRTPGTPPRLGPAPMIPPRPALRTPGTPPKLGLGPARPGEPIYPRRPQRPGAPRPGQSAGPGFAPPVGIVPPDPASRRGLHPVRGRSHATGGRGARDRETAAEKLLRVSGRARVAEPIVVDREITVTEGITVKDLCEKLGIKARDLIRRLLDQGIIATINHTLDPAMAEQVAQSFGARTKIVSFEEESVGLVEDVQAGGKQVKRAPVVTVMGHVDHGKTSLLDAIRETNVTAQEHGGITQHIGAYSVATNGRRIVFLDTPGHEAFTRMRARGAKVTDVVVLVVSADDGVMPQTLEAISHARAANVPIIVAINKIDKPGALPERVRKQLSDQGLVAEDWGGDVVMVEVSAKQKTNIPLLLEMILLVTDIQDRKANPDLPASGTVLEAKLDKGRGPVCSLLVINGTLRVGDSFLVGAVFGKVRAMLDDHGKPIHEAPPATPVEILGLQSLPQAGDQFQAVTDAIKAKQIALYRENKQRELNLARSSRLTLEQFQDQLKTGQLKELPIILKGDVQGSVEVVAESLGKIGDERVRVKVIHSAVGAITVSDVLLASASNSIIVGFNVRPERKAVETAAQEQVDIRLHTVIYDLIDEMRKALSGLLEPTHREIAVGKAEVRQTFRVAKVGNVAGSVVSEGKLQKDCTIRLLRDNVVIHTGKIGSLRRYKDDVEEVRSGLECGVVLANYGDIKAGDVIEAFITERVAAAALA